MPGVPAAAASGSHVCTGTIGALTANANMKATKNQRSVVGFIDIPTSWVRSKVPSPSWCDDTTYSPMIAASRISPPNRLYSKNLTAAYARCAPPNIPIKKYTGTSMTSNAT